MCAAMESKQKMSEVTSRQRSSFASLSSKGRGGSSAGETMVKYIREALPKSS